MWNYKIYDMANQSDRTFFLKYSDITPYFILRCALRRSSLGSQNAVWDIVLFHNTTKKPKTKPGLEEERTWDSETSGELLRVTQGREFRLS